MNDKRRAIIHRHGTPATSEIEAIATDVIACERCPRLRAYCREIARIGKKAHRGETYWARPVPGFGDPDAGLLIIGLAPGAHGANRTGRVFTGDKSGEWLYGELYRRGLATSPTSVRRDDGLRLRGVYITAAARCAPPDNRPSPEELSRCREYLVREMAALPNARVRLALGKIAFDAFWKARRELGLPDVRPRPEFGHGKWVPLPEGGFLLASFHPSQQNTATGKLTRRMWRGVFDRALKLQQG